MESKIKTAKKPKIVTKPYLMGKAFDSSTLLSALKYFGSLVIMAVLFLLLGTVLMIDNAVIRTLLNSAVMITTYLLFYNSGVSSGTTAVGAGEIAYQRKDTDRSVSADELSRCYHPAKGFVTALIGTVPVLICTILLAITAQQQSTGLSVLPSWLSTYERRAEVGNALAFYHVTSGMSMEDVLRVIVRMSMMPLVSLVGSTNNVGLLVLERLSPLLILMPAVFYGIGYTRGVAARTKVHTDIATNKRKRARKEKKQREARRAKEPEQLN